MLKQKNIIFKFWPYLFEGIVVFIAICWLLADKKLHLYFFLSPWGLWLGLLTAFFLFICGKCLVGGFGGMADGIKNFRPKPLYFSPIVSLIWIHLITALLEESFWRVCVQTVVFRGSLIGVLLAAIIFTVSHRKSLSSLGHWLDFIVFSFVLGFVYYCSHDFLLVVSTHFFRNMLILYDQYRQKAACGKE